VVTRLEQRTFDPLAVDHARLQPRSTASERAQWSTMHQQKRPMNRPRITSDFADVRASFRAMAHIALGH